MSWSISIPIAVFAAGCALPQSRAFGAQLDRYEREQPAPARDDDALFTGDAHLDRAALVRAVIDRNPDVRAAREAWRAAFARYPQETALDDPSVTYEVAPLSITGDARFGQSLQIEEKLPIPGRRALAGDVALAEADAMRGDVETARLELALMASTVYDDLYLANRSLAINAQHRALVEQLQKSAEVELAAGKGGAQDAIQAEVELALIEHDRVMLESAREIAIASLNALLHRRPDLALPPPPETIAPPPASDASIASLEDEALASRPELGTQRARIRGGKAAIELAHRDALPDVSLMARYDSMWDMPEHRWMLGVTFDVPLARDRRRGAVDEATAEAAKASAEYDRDVDRIRTDVALAAQRLAEARHLLTVYDERLVPSARARVDAVRAGFVADQARFSEVIDAERGLRAAELEREQTLADVSRRQAELDRAIGRVPGLGGAP